MLSYVNDLSNLDGEISSNGHFDTLYELPPPRQGSNHEICSFDCSHISIFLTIMRLDYEKVEHIWASDSKHYAFKNVFKDVNGLFLGWLMTSNSIG